MSIGISIFDDIPPPPPKKSQSIMAKCMIISGLVLASLIPLNMVNGLIHERQERKATVTNEIKQSWGGKQTIVGPILTIPYLSGSETKILTVFPSTLKTQIHMKPDMRNRGIFQTIVYTGDAKLDGNFDLSPLLKEIPKDRIVWKDSTLEFAISNTENIEKQAEIDWQGKQIPLISSAKSVLSTHVPINSVNNIPFKLTVSVRGSEQLTVAPIASQNKIDIDSTWPDPSFTGHLPSTRNINNKGFTASWDLGPLGIHPHSGYLSYPSEANNRSQGLLAQTLLAESVGSQLGVALLRPINAYRETERAIKYGTLFLVLTFATYLLFELIAKQPLHPFQYLLIASAISLFYLLLLAFSELAPFWIAYSIASCGIISTISLYSKAILGKIQKHAQSMIAGLLSTLYGYLYILLQLEDYSLVFGALGLFAILVAIMFVTRNIDWYGNASTVNA
jgi:inner membrane protein